MYGTHRDLHVLTHSFPTRPSYYLATCARLSALVKPAAQHGPGDVHLLDVDRAASNAPAPAVAHTPFHRKLLGVAISAHQLHRIARDFARDRIGEAFRGRAVENGGKHILRVRRGAPEDRKSTRL